MASSAVQADPMPVVHHFADELATNDPIYEYTPTLQREHTPIVIDNGSFKCRVGWATDDKPRMTFKNVIAKQRGKKDFEAQIGNDISNIEVVRWQLRSQFDRNLVTHYDCQEQVFDYTFSHLGITSEGCVDHPIVITEPVCNPNYCRQQMSELLFECYHVPQVAYGIDGMFSFYKNHPRPESADALMLSCGYHTLHVMPILDGQLQSRYIRRINMGGLQVDTFMQKLLQLKYPGHLNALTLSRAEELVRNHCYMPVDYKEQLESWANEDEYMKNVHIMELPHTNIPLPIVNPEAGQSRKEQQIRRLKEMNARRRLQRLAEEQEKLQEYLSIQEMAQDDEENFMKSLEENGFTNPMELQMAVNKLNNAINKLNNMINNPEEPEVIVDASKVKRSKEDKKHQSALQHIQSLKSEQEIDEYLQMLHKQRQDLLDLRARRKQRKSDMAKRRTVASQQRMKIITELAQGGRRKKDDNFGQNDDDWNVYKQINKDAGDSDSETELEKLDEFEYILREFDPNFKGTSLEQSQATVDPKEYWRLYVGVERIRIPELLFQPSMMGLDQAGLSETIDFVLKKFSEVEQKRLVQYIYLTGGPSSFPNFKDRLEHDLLSLRPFQSTFKIYSAQDPIMDSWYGARRFALQPGLQAYSITKDDYLEKGGDYLKEHICSNKYFPTPVVPSSAGAATEVENT